LHCVGTEYTCWGALGARGLWGLQRLSRAPRDYWNKKNRLSFGRAACPLTTAYESCIA